MKRIILIRHGQSLANVKTVGGKTKDTYVNECELGLTDRGKYQAYRIAEKLSLRMDNYYKDKLELWTSPFTRARETAQLINDKLHIRKVYEDPRLSEQDFGNFDYQFMKEWEQISPHSYFVNQRRYESRHARFWARLEGGESFSDVYNRVSLFDLSRCQNNPNDQIIVTHGCFIIAAIMYFTGKTVEFVYDFEKENRISNCSAYILEKEGWTSCYELKEIITLDDLVI